MSEGSEDRVLRQQVREKVLAVWYKEEGNLEL